MAAEPAVGTLTGSVPPHSLSAERATLGSILLDSGVFNEVVSTLSAEDFYRYANGEVFRAISALNGRNEPVDLITLSDELTRRGKLENVGGAGYLSSLTSEVPSSSNVGYYARIVRETSIRRRLIRVAAEITADAQSEGASVRPILDEAERRIFELAEQDTAVDFQSAADIVNRTIDAIEAAYRRQDAYTGIPSGFPQLDRMLSGFQKSEFIVIGARPGVGKTALALSIAANISVRQKRPVGFFSLEMSNMSIMQRLICAEARVDSNRVRSGALRHSDFPSIMEAAGQLYEARLFISDTPSMRLLELRAQARRMKAQHDVDIIFVDYITLVTTETPGNTPRHEQVAEISRSLKSLARELDIPVVALSQVTRDTEGRKPALANIRESDAIAQDADVVMFLHRPMGTDQGSESIPLIETDLIVAKQRNGPVGTVPIGFIPRFAKYEPMTHEDY